MKNIDTLPQLSGGLFLTDGGIETSLIYRQGFDLPYFAAFDLLKSEEGRQGLRDYYIPYLDLAKEFHTGFILESPTWRANPDWIEKLGYPLSALSDINRDAVALMVELYEEYVNDVPDLLISGCVGPRGDGYKVESRMFVERAEKYHRAQIEIFADTPVDMVTAITMNYPQEAIGVTRAANSVRLPVVISFTVETNGRLSGGESLQEAIEAVDSNVDIPPEYYMINCAHPTHFQRELESGTGSAWVGRIRGIRANASHKSHAELDEATELDSGNPIEFGNEHCGLHTAFGQLNVFGGCCGSDERHIHQIIKQIS